MWQIQYCCCCSPRLIEYSSTIKSVYRRISPALSNRLMTVGGEREKTFSWSWIHWDTRRMCVGESGNSSHASMQLILLDTKHPPPPHHSAHMSREWKGFNKKLRDHIMENTQITTNRNLLWKSCEINTWWSEWEKQSDSLFEVLVKAK